jgi:hypothetical protein
MSDPFSSFIDQIHRVSWGGARPDYYDSYQSEYLSRENGTLMPASPGVKRYRIYIVPDANRNLVRYHLEVEPNEFLLRLYQELEDPQILHRSRQVALAASQLRVFTLDKRNDRMRRHASILDNLAIPDRVQTDLLKLLDDTIVFKYDPAYLYTFLKEHEKAGVGRGLKWGMLYESSRSQWLEAMTLVDEIKYHLFNDWVGYYMNRPMWSGLRQKNKNPVLSKAKGMGKSIYTFDGSINETRIVNYTASLSSWNAWMPGKEGMYAKIITEVLDMVDLGIQVVTPLIQGGHVYTVVRDALANGMYHTPYDMGSSEAVVGALLRRKFSQFFTPVQEWDILTSGIGLTTILTMVVSLLVIKAAFGQQLHKEDLLCLFGDDWNFLTKKPLKDPGLGEIAEIDPLDRNQNFVLGVAFKPDIEAPRADGIKLTADRGDKAIGVDLSSPTTREIKGHASYEESETWYGLYHGVVSKTQTLLQALENALPQEWELRGPGARVQALAER